MHTEIEYILWARGGDLEEGTEDPSAPIHFMVDLVESDPQQPADEEAPEPDPLIIRVVPNILTLLGHEIFTGDRVVRVEVARTAQIDGEWPVICATIREFEACIAQIHRYENDVHHKELYPVRLWVLPREDAQAAIRVIEAWRLLPEDEALEQELLETIDIAIEMFPSFVDVSTILSRRDRVLRWVKGAVMQCGLKVEWKIRENRS